MAGITLAQAQAQLDTYLEASKKAATGQKVEIEGQAITRADFEKIGQAIKYWDAQVKTLSMRASGRQRNRVVMPRW